MAGRILFADDGSPAADLAWLWINSQHWGGDWDVDALTAFPRGGEGPCEPREWEPPHPREPLGDLGRVRHLRCDCDPCDAIAAHADGRLVVIGPRGGGLLKSLGIGSTAARLIRNPPAPLLVVKNGNTVRRALVCTDGSDDALAAAQALCRGPWISDIDVHVISVVQRDFDAGLAAARTAEVLEGQAKTVMPRAVRPHPLDPFPSVVDVVLQLQQELDSDLLVQGATGLSRWQSLRTGSVAVALAERAPCSVLLVHGPHVPDPVAG